MQTRRAWGIGRTCAVAVCGIAALSVLSVQGSVRTAAPVSLGVPGRTNADVSLAAADRFVAAVWSASTEAGVSDIYAAVSRDAGATFSAASRVNSTPGAASVGGEQPPRVSLVPKAGGEPTLVVVWTAKRTAGTALMTSRSADGGRTFSREAVVPGTNAAGNRGWESIATDRNGRVDAIWLDHRDAAQAGSMGDMSHHTDHNTSASVQMDSVAKAQLSKLYFGTLGEPSSARALTSGVCYCCKTALAVGADGAIYAAWRHVYPGNLRDIAFTLSRDGGRTFAAPIRVSEDKWAIDGCPENGPAIAIDAKHTIHLAWPTLIGGSDPAGTLGLFYAASRDGRQFSPRETVPTSGTPRHVQMAAARDGSIVLVWDEAEPSGRVIALARGSIDAQGRVAFHRQTLPALGDASYPAFVLTPDGALVAAVSAVPAEPVIRFTAVHLEPSR